LSVGTLRGVHKTGTSRAMPWPLSIGGC
jgi:hypothetical protein